MAKQITRDRKLTPEEAAKYRKIRKEVELEKPEIIAKAQQARCEARRQQLAAIMQELKAAREAKGLSLADIFQRTGMDRSALSKLENVTNENPTIDTLLRYAEVVGKRLQIQVLDS
jgi:DNA-binding phage protein